MEQKYQIKSEIEHILSRSGMYVGSTSSNVVNYPLYLPSKNKIQLMSGIGKNDGLLKLIDEIISNSIDEYRRKDSLFQITEISIDVDNTGFVTVQDNGGILVEIHKQTGKLIPELIFGTLRSSSNYDDTQEREVVGTNGLGSKLTNIFSKQFIVETADSKNKVKVEWKNNMRDVAISEIVKSSEHYTKISFQLDIERFEMEEIGLHTIRILQRRCIDAAAANPGLKINFTSDIAEGKLNSVWLFNNFKEYISMYLDEKQIPSLIEYKNKKDDIVILPENLGFNVSFVNGVLCSEGTHIKKLEKQLSEAILAYCAKNDMELITEKDILQRISIFVNTTVINPTYNSQSKEVLTNKIDKFILNFSSEFLAGLKDSEIIRCLRDFYEIKYAEVKKKELRQLNKTLSTTKSKKLISCASKDTSTNELWLFEGNSASNGFMKHRSLFQSAYLLRGKIVNTFNLNRNQIVENIELREVIASLGILFGEGAKNLKNLKFNKIVFATDMDHDGSHIAGLLVAFFGKHFPELFKAGKIYRALSPIVIASKKGAEKQYFYTLESYEAVANNLKGWEIIYTKGLGGLDDVDYRQMLRNQKLIQFQMTGIDDLESITVWFDKSTDMRKQLIMNDNGETEE
jgi:DNA topoisomerase-2